jgi:hypothetical protein
MDCMTVMSQGLIQPYDVSAHAFEGYDNSYGTLSCFFKVRGSEFTRFLYIDAVCRGYTYVSNGSPVFQPL